MRPAHRLQINFPKLASRSPGTAPMAAGRDDGTADRRTTDLLAVAGSLINNLRLASFAPGGNTLEASPRPGA